MTTVGFIGSGAIGRTIARLAVEAGHQVVLSNSRGPEILADTAAELGPPLDLFEELGDRYSSDAARSGYARARAHLPRAGGTAM